MPPRPVSSLLFSLASSCQCVPFPSDGSGGASGSPGQGARGRGPWWVRPDWLAFSLLGSGLRSPTETCLLLPRCGRNSQFMVMIPRIYRAAFPPGALLALEAQARGRDPRGLATEAQRCSVACLRWRSRQVAEAGSEFQSQGGPRISGRSPEGQRGSWWPTSSVPKGSVFTPCSMPACHPPPQPRLRCRLTAR